ALLDELRLAGAFACDSFEFGLVRLQQCGAAIAREVHSLRISKHRPAIGNLNQASNIREGVLAVIRNHEYRRVLQGFARQSCKFSRMILVERLLHVEADELLVARQYAQLENG